MVDSLREYLAFMKGRGLVLEIGEWVAREDIPEVVELLSDRGRVIRFEHVEGYDCEVVANLVPSHEALRTLLGGEDAYALFLEGIKRVRKTKAVEREGLETIDMTGRDLLSVLPMLKHCEKDSAPFITTGIVSAIDPVRGVVGRGIHRLEYRGGNRLGVTLVNPPLSDILQSYGTRGERMRLAVTLGVDPLLFLSMALKVGPDTDKLEVAGGLKGDGVKVIDLVETGVSVPAGAEFYLEGFVDCDDVRKDGPLGEISGYYMALEGTPTLVVSRISRRSAPLYHALLPTSLEGDAYLTFVSRAHVEDAMKKLFPFIQDMAFVQKTFGASVVVSVRPVERAKIRNLLMSMLAFPMIKKVVVVDGDVDPYSLRDVEWAVVTRCVADQDVIIIGGLQGQSIDPQARGRGLGVAKTGIDATMQGKDMEERARVAAGNRARIEKVLRSIGLEPAP
jgi:2,5-furandicarboxylate decarboxylase 1